MSTVVIAEQPKQQELADSSQSRTFADKRRIVQARRLAIAILTISLLTLGLLLAGWSSNGLLTKW